MPQTWNIYIKTLKGKPTTLDVNPTDTINAVKAKIQYKKGILFRQQCLFFAHNQLADHRKLTYYNIEDGSTLNLVLNLRGGMLVGVTNSTTCAVVFVFSYDTVEKMKEKIFLRLGIHPEHQKLFFREIELANNRTLADYNILNQNNVRLEVCLPSIQIFVRDLYGKTMTLDCEQRESILALKTKLSNKLKAEDEHILPKDMRLLFAGWQLEDHKTLADYNIRRESTLHLALRLRGGMHHVTSTGKVKDEAENEADTAFTEPMEQANNAHE